MVCGRTLFGKNPVKAQELDDHYYSRLKLRVAAFMKDLDVELWKLGITAKTKHHEVAPAQHELATIYTTANIACDHNQLTMEIMKKTAKLHGFACILHEKPFSGVNGSGKHINWSISTDTGKNLLDPGKTPEENIQFLLIIGAIIKAIDENAGLLRCSMASPSNDCRLGSSEAPPAIISMYLGSQLEDILMSLVHNKEYVKSNNNEKPLFNIPSIPSFQRDTTDRNRTSPIAFTGNKFEFRMCGSMASIARPCAIINAIVANELEILATKLDRIDELDPENKDIYIKSYIYEMVNNHKRIIYSGNNYSSEWRAEAARRGLPNYPDTVSAISCLADEKSVEMLERMKILTRPECDSRVETMYENYAKTLNIEAQIMVEMASRQIIPAAMRYIGNLSAAARDLAALSIDNGEYISELQELTRTVRDAKAELGHLQTEHDDSSLITDVAKKAMFFRDTVLPTMSKLREACDKLEAQIPENEYPLPSYFDMMYRV